MMVETDQSEVVLNEGDNPSTVFILTRTVRLCLSGGARTPQPVKKTDDATVLAWTEATIEADRREVLDPLRFTG